VRRCTSCFGANTSIWRLGNETWFLRNRQVIFLLRKCHTSVLRVLMLLSARTNFWQFQMRFLVKTEIASLEPKLGSLRSFLWLHKGKQVFQTRFFTLFSKIRLCLHRPKSFFDNLPETRFNLSFFKVGKN
jgi:hypothetical protein